MGRVISFANQKGGVAKTTTTLNLGVAFSEQGLKVLLAALVVTQTVGGDGQIVLDARLAGVGAAAAAIAARAPLPLVAVVAAAATALVRLLM